MRQLSCSKKKQCLHKTACQNMLTFYCVGKHQEFLIVKHQVENQNSSVLLQVMQIFLPKALNTQRLLPLFLSSY